MKSILQVLYNQAPYKGKSLPGVLFAIQRGEPPFTFSSESPTPQTRMIPPGRLKDLIQQCWNGPAGRPSAADIYTAFLSSSPRSVPSRLQPGQHKVDHILTLRLNDALNCLGI